MYDERGQTKKNDPRTAAATTPPTTSEALAKSLACLGKTWAMYSLLYWPDRLGPREAGAYFRLVSGVNCRRDGSQSCLWHHTPFAMTVTAPERPSVAIL